MAVVNARPIRVFHVIKSLGRGGAETLLTDGPRSSDPARFQYGFGYFLPHKRALVPELERQFGSVTCFPAQSGVGMLRQVARLARHLRHWNADVVHCHLPLAGVVGRVAGALARLPVVYTEHNVIERYHPATRLAAQATWPLQRQVVAVSAEVRDSILRRFGHGVPVRVIRNGVSPERFLRSKFDGAAVRKRLGIDPNAAVIGTVEVFRKQKRLELWLSAAKSILEQHSSARFLVVGDGPLRAELERQVAALGLAGKVLLPGLQEDVAPYLAAMDVYMMSSDFEGVPIALLEAMSMEVTPVVTDAGGIPEVIEQGVSGFVSPRGDTGALTAAVCRLLAEGSTRRRQYGEHARSRVSSDFGTTRMMRELEEVYEGAVGR